MALRIEDDFMAPRSMGRLQRPRGSATMPEGTLRGKGARRG
jgi:hypothetical protein